MDADPWIKSEVTMAGAHGAEGRLRSPRGEAATSQTPLVRALPAISILIAAVLAAYANAFTATWQFDDFAAILGNPAAQSLAGWWHALPGIRPLLKLSYAFTHETGGGVIAVHATNIAIHALNACLLWALLRRWLPTLAPSLEHPDLAALLAALLFAVHPAATEAVTYASGRSISLAATFCLGALLADDVSRAHPSDRTLAWSGPAAFALALAVRETALVIPVIPLLRAWATGRSLRAEFRRLRRYALVAAIAAVAAALTPGYQRFFGASLDARSLVEQAMGQLLAHGYLLTQSLLGVCNIDPDLRVPAHVSPALIASALLLAVLIATMFSSRRHRPWLAFAIGWYFVLLAPANSLLPRLDLVNDRHLYLAVAGPALALSCVLVGACARPAGRLLACASALVLCTAAAFATAQRNTDYRSEVALWQATVRDSPDKARAWLNLGYAYRLAGDTPQAAAAYRCALALEPDNEQAAINLGLAAPEDAGPMQCPARQAVREAASPSRTEKRRG